MNLNPFKWFQKSTPGSFDDVLQRLSLHSKTASGEVITESSALNAPTLYSAVTSIPRTISQLPIEIIRTLPDGSKVREKQHELYRLMNVRPNEWQSRYEYWNLVATHLMLHNVFYAYKNTDPRGKVLNLHPIHPSLVRVEQGEDMRLVYKVRMHGSEREYPASKIHRVMMLSTDGITPVSPLEKMRETIGLEIAAEKYGAAMFESMAVPNVIIKRPGHFNDKESFDRFRETWQKMFRKKGGTAILEDGFEIEKLQLTAEESQFLETRRLQRSVLAGALNITPHRIGDLSRSTFNNVEQMGLEHINYSIMPYLVAIESALLRDVIPESDQDTLRIKFNVDGLLRGDSKSRAEALQIRRQWGIINANEWRELDEMNRIPDTNADAYITPLNYTTGKEPEPGKDTAKSESDKGSNEGDEGSEVDAS